MDYFQKNKCTRWYRLIVAAARERAVSGYVERHHILPHCMGGTNDASNMVALTPREHFICHNLLTRMTTGQHQRKMFHSFWLMSNMNSNDPDRYVKHTSASYSRVREAHAKYIGDHLRGKKRGRQKNPRGPASEQTRRNMSAARIGIIFTPEHCENLKHAKGKKWVTDGTNSKLVSDHQFQTFINSGWKAGRISWKSAASTRARR